MADRSPPPTSRARRGPRPGREPERLAGLHPVAEALRAGRRDLARLLVRRGASGRELEEVIALARGRGLPVEEVAETELARLVPAGGRAQGVVLEAGPLPEPPLETLLAGPGASPRILVALDGVEDPQNAGAVARVAEAAGAFGLVLTHRRAPPLGPALARASAGAIEHLAVSRVPNLRRAIKLLKEHGFWAIGADPEGAVELFGCEDRLLSGDLVLVLGAEGRGLRPGVREVLDARVRIPLAGTVASLNVSSAAAVILFELRRRRGLAGRA